METTARFGPGSPEINSAVSCTNGVALGGSHTSRPTHYESVVRWVRHAHVVYLCTSGGSRCPSPNTVRRSLRPRRGHEPAQSARRTAPALCRLTLAHTRAVDAVHQTAAVTTSAAKPDVVIADLLADPISAADVRTRLPAAAGLYAWWANPAVLSALPGPEHPSVPALRLLYIGIATKLRSRLASNHLGRTGSSTLRRTLAGLLLHDEQYRTRWTDRVVLVNDDERRLTSWMVTHLHVSWCEHPTPRDVEESIIHALRPPLNVDHASGPALELVKEARWHYYASAGPRRGEHPGLVGA